LAKVDGGVMVEAQAVGKGLLGDLTHFVPPGGFRWRVIQRTRRKGQG